MNTNVCFLCDNIIHPQIGGIERVTYSLVKAFQHHAINVNCISQKPNSKSNGIEDCKNINQHFLPDNLENISAKNLIFLTNFLLENEIDIIINQSTYFKMHELVILVKRELKIKLISTLHTAPDFNLKSIKDNYLLNNIINSPLKMFSNKVYGVLKYPVSWLLRYKDLRRRYSKVYQQSDAVVLLSTQFKKTFLKIANVDDSNKLYAIANPCSFSETVVQLKKKNQILFVGRMILQAKRPDRILKIWNKINREYPFWNLIMIGDGPDLDDLKKLALKLKLTNISFTGNVNPENYYRESKILCLTSSYEGFGMVLTEAQQNGCVPIAFDSFESLKDIIEDGKDGLIIPPFDIKLYKEKLRLLMDDDIVREKISRKAMESCKRFNIEEISQDWLNLFNRI